MSNKKGDLVLVSDGLETSTCVILSEPFTLSSSKQASFYYAYSLETGVYGLIYDYEIVSLVCEDFASDLDMSVDLFDIDRTFYDYYFEMFSYFPQFYPDDDSSEDD